MSSSSGKQTSANKPVADGEYSGVFQDGERKHGQDKSLRVEGGLGEGTVTWFCLLTRPYWKKCTLGWAGLGLCAGPLQALASNLTGPSPSGLCTSLFSSRFPDVDMLHHPHPGVLCVFEDENVFTQNQKKKKA